MVFFHRTRRATAAVLALLLICALCLPVPAAKAKAPASYSAELKLKLDGKELQTKLSADLDDALLALQTKTAASIGTFSWARSRLCFRTPCC